MKTYYRFAEAEATPPPPEKARFHILPVPYEKHVSYGHGTAAGPAAILEASQQLEIYNAMGMPARDAGIFTHPPVVCRGSVENVMNAITAKTTAILQQSKIPVMLGGEHTVSFGAVRAVQNAYPARTGKPTFGVVQFDAHADLRDSFRGTPWSHACVMRRIVDLGIPLFQLAVRSLSEPEQRFRTAQKIPHLDAVDFSENGIPTTLLPKNFPRQIYLTFDIDALDPSLVPGTGTPEPGGLFWWDALRLLRRVMAGRQVLGFDIVEVAPQAGAHVSEFTAARLAYEIMAMIGAGEKRKK